MPGNSGGASFASLFLGAAGSNLTSLNLGCTVCTPNHTLAAGLLTMCVFGCDLADSGMEDNAAMALARSLDGNTILTDLNLAGTAPYSPADCTMSHTLSNSKQAE